MTSSTPTISSSTFISVPTISPPSRLVLGLANLIFVPATASRSNPIRDRRRSRPPSSGFRPAGVPATHWTTRCRCSRSLRTGISNRVRTRASLIGSSSDHKHSWIRRRVARPSYLDHDLDLDLDLYSDYYANSNFNSAHNPDINFDLDLDLDVDVDMPFRSNHIPPSPAAEQCMNPQLASRTVLRCERPYLDVDIGNVDRTGYQYGNVDEDMNMGSGSGSGSGRTYSYNYNYNPAEVRVKEEFEPVPRSGWVSPFESWQRHGLRPVQLGNRPGLDSGPTSTSRSKHTEQVYYPQNDQYGPGSGRGQRAFQIETEMGPKVEIGAEVDMRMRYDMQPRAGTALGYYQYPQDHQQTGSRSFDMQPMVLNMPPIQHPGPPRYTSDAGLPRLASQGQYQIPNQAQMQGQAQGHYNEEYAASTPSTTSSVYQYPGPSPNTNPNVHAQVGARAGWQPSGSDRGVDFGMPDMESAAGTGTGQGNSPLKAGLPRTSSSGLGAGSGMGASGQMGLGDRSGSGTGEASGSMGQGGRTNQPGQAGDGLGASGSAPGEAAGGSGGPGGKAIKKKAAKACLQCQRAHLTCDDCEYEVCNSVTLFSGPRRTAEYGHLLCDSSALYTLRQEGSR